MKILHLVESYLPQRHGMSECVAQVSQRLALQGHGVSVATAADPSRRQMTIGGVEVAEFAIGGSAVRGFQGPASEVQRYREFLRTSAYDVVAMFAAQQWAVDIALMMLKEIRGRKVFVPTGFSALGDPQYQAYFQNMAGWMKAVDANVFLSERYRDAEFARQHGIANSVIIPNGAAAEEFMVAPAVDVRRQLGIPEDNFLILHVGGFTGVKGQREAVEIFRRSRLNHATLLLISNDFDRITHPPGPNARKGLPALCSRIMAALRFLPSPPGDVESFRRYVHRVGRQQARYAKAIRLASLSREQTVGAFRAADLFLFPSLIECSPIVLFEALASKTPFLATDAGNSAEIAAISGGGEILPTRKDAWGYSHAEIAASASVLADVFADMPRRRRMAASGFTAWQDRFTWEKIASRYASLYESLLNTAQTHEAG